VKNRHIIEKKHALFGFPLQPRKNTSLIFVGALFFAVVIVEGGLSFSLLLSHTTTASTSFEERGSKAKNIEA
jgi:hypothetical protein